jgi:NADH:ubiquinone oxidoreductase subunit 6 (subunit J)
MNLVIYYYYVIVLLITIQYLHKAPDSGSWTKELVLPATLGAALVLVIAVSIVMVIKFQKDKANMKKLIKSLTVQSSSEITMKGDVNKQDYENIEICEQKAATKTVDIEVNENPAYSTVRNL